MLMTFLLVLRHVTDKYKGFKAKCQPSDKFWQDADINQLFQPLKQNNTFY